MNQNNFEYVVLSDGDTYDGVDNSFVYVLTDVGNEILCNSDGIDQVSTEHIIEKISIAELLDCYYTYANK